MNFRFIDLSYGKIKYTVPMLGKSPNSKHVSTYDTSLPFHASLQLLYPPHEEPHCKRSQNGAEHDGPSYNKKVIGAFTSCW